jgi:cytochrome P450
MPLLNSFVANPYRYFRWARRLSPILWVNLFEFQGWLVTGLPEAEAILKDPRFIRNHTRIKGAPELPPHVKPAYDAGQRMILFQDAPDHTRIRKLVVKAFSPTMVSRLRGDIERYCDELIARRAGFTEHELVGQFAHLLPLRTIMRLLGVPAEDEALFRAWSDAFIHMIDITATLEVWEQVAPAVEDFQRYMEALIAAKRRAPSDDLISALITVEERGDTLTLDEMVSMCMLLLMAGHDTTSNLITSGFYWLLKNPKQLDRLKADPSRVGDAVEEMLRYDGPGLLTVRWPAEDLTFAGKAMKRGHVVMIALGGANRDPRVFRKPDVFDITRTPNRHIAFAAGVHYCLGAALGRLEAAVAIEKLVTRFVNPVLMGEPKRRPSIVLRGFERLDFRATVT